MCWRLVWCDGAMNDKRTLGRPLEGAGTAGAVPAAELAGAVAVRPHAAEGRPQRRQRRRARPLRLGAGRRRSRRPAHGPTPSLGPQVSPSPAPLPSGTVVQTCFQLFAVLFCRNEPIKRLTFDRSYDQLRPVFASPEDPPTAAAAPAPISKVFLLRLIYQSFGYFRVLFRQFWISERNCTDDSWFDS